MKPTHAPNRVGRAAQGRREDGKGSALRCVTRRRPTEDKEMRSAGCGLAAPSCSPRPPSPRCACSPPRAFASKEAHFYFGADDGNNQTGLGGELSASDVAVNSSGNGGVLRLQRSTSPTAPTTASSASTPTATSSAPGARTWCRTAARATWATRRRGSSSCTLASECKAGIAAGSDGTPSANETQKVHFEGLRRRRHLHPRQPAVPRLQPDHHRRDHLGQRRRHPAGQHASRLGGRLWRRQLFHRQRPPEPGRHLPGRPRRRQPADAGLRHGKRLGRLLDHRGNGRLRRRRRHNSRQWRPRQPPGARRRRGHRQPLRLRPRQLPHKRVRRRRRLHPLLRLRRRRRHRRRYVRDLSRRRRCTAGIAGAGAGQIGSTSASARTHGIAVSPPGAAFDRLYLADSGNRRVNTYDLDGQNPASFGSATEFGTDQPRQLAVDSRGIVYASNDANNGEVERYDSLDANGGGVGFLAPIGAEDPGQQRVADGLVHGPDRGCRVHAQLSRR